MFVVAKLIATKLQAIFTESPTNSIVDNKHFRYWQVLITHHGDQSHWKIVITAGSTPGDFC